jgi:hypothetical protein
MRISINSFTRRCIPSNAKMHLHSYSVWSAEACLRFGGEWLAARGRFVAERFVDECIETHMGNAPAERVRAAKAEAAPPHSKIRSLCSYRPGWALRLVPIWSKVKASPLLPWVCFRSLRRYLHRNVTVRTDPILPGWH